MNVADIRAAYGWSQRDLAKLLNVAPFTVQRWESGASPPTGLARDVLQALDLAALILTLEQRARVGGELTLGLGAFLARRIEVELRA